ncbi:MAG: nucleotidyltransferase domain-containing protein [Cyanobacteria bacterium P01_F01_bin.116]
MGYVTVWHKLILEEVTQWASFRTDIVAAALGGSWARGTAWVNSDIDLMLLVTAQHT